MGNTQNFGKRRSLKRESLPPMKRRSTLKGTTIQTKKEEGYTTTRNKNNGRLNRASSNIAGILSKNQNNAEKLPMLTNQQIIWNKKSENNALGKSILSPRIKNIMDVIKRESLMPKKNKKSHAIKSEVHSNKHVPSLQKECFLRIPLYQSPQNSIINDKLIIKGIQNLNSEDCTICKIENDETAASPTKKGKKYGQLAKESKCKQVIVTLIPPKKTIQFSQDGPHKIFLKNNQPKVFEAHKKFSVTYKYSQNNVSPCEQENYSKNKGSDNGIVYFASSPVLDVGKPEFHRKFK